MSKAVRSRSTITTSKAGSEEPSSSTRRRLLAGSGLAAIAAALGLTAVMPQAQSAPFAPAIPPEHQDAALLAACVAFFEIEEEVFALEEGPDEDREAALECYCEAYEAVAEIRPTSLVGLKAKTRAMMSGFEMMVASDIGSTVEDSAEWQDLGVWQLMHDVLALEVAA